MHALARLYTLQYGEQGQADVERLLSDYLVVFPTEEDVLRPLMEVLAQQERFSDVRTWLERTRAALNEDGQTLSVQTSDLWEYVHAKQVQRRRTQRAPRTQTAPEAGSLRAALLEVIAAGVASVLEQRDEHLEDEADDMG